MLLDAVISAVKTKMEIKNEDATEEMTASQIQNVKLQLEQIIPILCSLLDLKHSDEQNTTTDIDVIEHLDQTVNTYCAILITMSTIAGKVEWVEIICKQVNRIGIIKMEVNHSF